MSGHECMKCGAEMIWGGDHDEEHEDFIMVSNFSCPSCDSYMEFFTSKYEAINGESGE